MRSTDPYYLPESHKRRTGIPFALICALTTAVTAASLSACAPNDAEVAASLSANPAALDAIPRLELTNIGTEVWRQPTGVSGSAPFTVDHTGLTFMLAVNSAAGMKVLIGDASTGAVRANFDLGQGANWPDMVGSSDGPIVAAAVPSPDGSDLTGTITAWDGSGTIRWSRSAEDLGASPGTDLKVDPAEGDRFIIRSSTGAVTPFQDASLWLLDADSGATVWQSPSPVRWAQGDMGLLMYTWRSDNDAEAPSDRVTIRSLSDATELSTFEVANDFGARSSKNTQCGGIATATKVVICQWRGEDRTTLLADTSGEVIGQWSSSSKPIIDDAVGTLTVFGAEDQPVVAGINAENAEQLWSYQAGDLGESILDIRGANDGLMVGGLGDLNIVMSSLTGEFLLAAQFETLRPGSVVTPYVVDFRNGDVVGHSGTGVGVGILPTADDPTIFVPP